jgi:hypothetical protein
LVDVEVAEVAAPAPAPAAAVPAAAAGADVTVEEPQNRAMIYSCVVDTDIFVAVVLAVDAFNQMQSKYRIRIRMKQASKHD